MKHLLLLIISTFFISGCESILCSLELAHLVNLHNKQWPSIALYNDSCQEIWCDLGTFVHTANGDIVTISGVYPDSSIRKKGYDIDALYINGIKPGEKETLLSLFNETMEDFLNNNTTNDTLSLYIFSVDTLKKYSWDIIRNEYKVLVRYDIGVTDCKTGQYLYEVHFPPTEKMRNVHMWPQYEEVLEKYSTK